MYNKGVISTYWISFFVVFLKTVRILFFTCIRLEKQEIAFSDVLDVNSIFFVFWKSITTESFPHIRLIFCGFVKNKINFIFFHVKEFNFLVV